MLLTTDQQPQTCPSNPNQLQYLRSHLLSPFSSSLISPPPPRSNRSCSTTTIHSNMHLGSLLRGRKSRQSHPCSPAKLFTKIKHIISSSSPEIEKPKTWDEYVDAYSQGTLDIEDPPLPPLSAQLDPDGPFQAKYFPAPLPKSESSRQAVLNRLGYYEPIPSQHPPCSSASSESSIFPDSPPFSSPPTPMSACSTFSFLNSLQDLALKQRVSSPKLSSPISDGESPLRTPTSLTLQDHPGFHDIINRCQSHFSATASMITVLDDDRGVYLAENGLGGVKSFKRDLAFCAHTVLNGNRVFTIADTKADWRFAHHPGVEQGIVRSYAGAPIFAPHLSGLIQSPIDDPICIGTICFIGNHPRSFSDDERATLVELAVECRELIANWFLEKVTRKIERLESISLSDWAPSPQPLNSHTKSTSVRPTTIPQVSLPSTPISLSPQKPNPGSGPSINFAAHTSFSSKREKSNRARNHPPPELSTLFRKPSTPFHSLSTQQAAKFDLATKLLAETLELSIVYLVAVMPPSPAFSYELENNSPSFSNPDSSRPQTPRKPIGKVHVVSSYNLPTPAPDLDYELHRKAICNGPDGLILQNSPPLRSNSRPSSALAREEREAEWQEVEAFAYDRAHDARIRARRKQRSAATSDPNRAGILLSIGAERQMGRLSFALPPTSPFTKSSAEEVALGGSHVCEGGGGGGFVLVGYSHDPKRVLGLEDLAYFKHFSRELAKDVDELFETHLHSQSSF